MSTNDTAARNLAERTKRLFGDAPLKLQVAALPWRRGPDGVEVMLITSRDSGRWVLPKGWPEKNEDLSRAAEREAVEEAGIAGAVSRHEAGRYVYAKGRAAGAIACEVRVFPLQVKRVSDKWKEAGQRRRRWMSGDEAAAAVREEELAELIFSFCEHVRRSAA